MKDEKKYAPELQETYDIKGAIKGNTKASIGHSSNYTLPITVNPITIGFDPETPQWLQLKIEERWEKAGLNPRDFDLKIGQINLKYDQLNGAYAGVALDPLKLDPIEINKSLIDVIGNTALGNIPLRMLKTSLQEHGFDPDKLFVSKIAPLGPSAQLDLGIGKNPKIGASARIGGIKVVLKYNESPSSSYTIEGTFNLGAGIGGSFAKNQTNEGISTQAGIKFGLWSVQLHHKNTPSPSPKNGMQNSVSVLVPSLSTPPSTQKPNYPHTKIPLKTNYSPVIQQKITEVQSLYKNSPKKQESFNRYFHEKDKTNTRKLTQIKEEIQSSFITEQEKVQTTMSLIHELHGEIHGLREELKQKHQQEAIEKQQAGVLANFKSIEAGFGLIAELGSMTKNKAIQTIGTIGMSVTQGILGVASLTGTMGVAQTAGLTCLGPIGMIGGAVISLSGLFMRKGSGGKGLAKALKAISKQIITMHKAMLEGFGIIIENQKFTLELIEQGFRHIDSQLYTIIIQNQETHLKLDRLLKEIQGIGKDLQRMSLIGELKDLEKIQLKKSNLLALISIDDPFMNAQYIKAINTVLFMADKASSPNLTKVEERGNGLNGWLHIRHLEPCISNYSLSKNNLTLNETPNLIWWQKLAKYYFELSPDTCPKGLPKPILELYGTLQTKLIQQANNTIEFMNIIGSRSFIEQLIYDYQDKLETICTEANRNLNNISQLYGEKAACQLAQQTIQNNSCVMNVTWSVVLDSITKNSLQLVQSYPNLHEALAQKAKEYNATLLEFQFMLHILASIMQVKPKLISKVASLTEINEHFYNGTRPIQNKKNIAGKEVNIHYISGNLVSLFKPALLSSDEIALIAKAMHERSELIIENINNLKTLISLYEVTESKPLSYKQSVLLASKPKPELLPIAFCDEQELFQIEQDLKEIQTLLKPVSEMIKHPTKPPVLVFGGSGSGKSTFLNYAKDTEYCTVDDESEQSLEGYLLKPKNAVPEYFEVGMGESSKTLYPMLWTSHALSYSLCDLAGYPDNQGSAHTFSAASVTSLFVKASPQIKGFIYVAEWNSIRVERSKVFTDSLVTFANIMKENLSKLSKSLVLVITKTEMEKTPITKEHVVNNLRALLIREQKKPKPSEDERKKIAVLELLLETDSIIISSILDNGNQRPLIHSTLESFEELDNTLFSFEQALESQVKIKSKLVTVAQIYLRKHEELNNILEVMNASSSDFAYELIQRFNGVVKILKDHQNLFAEVKALIVQLKMEDSLLTDFVQKFDGRIYDVSALDKPAVSVDLGNQIPSNPLLKLNLFTTNQSPSLSAQLTNALRHYGFDRYNYVPGDGNCLFYAIIDQYRIRNIVLFNDSNMLSKTDYDLVMTLRNGIADYIENHPEDYKEFFPCDEYSSVSDFINKVRQFRNYAGHIEIVILSKMLNINITIVRQDKVVTSIHSDSSNQTIYLGLTDYRSGNDLSNHYYSLVGTPNQNLLDSIKDIPCNGFNI